MSTPFAAVLLAGGQSRRMGRDKALLPLADGRRLWERQLDVLRVLGPAQLFVSGLRRPGFPVDLICLEDDPPGQGPLGGIVAALRRTRPQPLLAVLAIDLPQMTADYLRRLLDQAGPGRGAIPQRIDGHYEPLAAVYPVECLPLAEVKLRGNQRSLQDFVAEAAKLLPAVPVRESEQVLFTNWNTPADAAG